MRLCIQDIFICTHCSIVQFIWQTWVTMKNFMYRFNNYSNNFYKENNNKKEENLRSDFFAIFLKLFAVVKFNNE